MMQQLCIKLSADAALQFCSAAHHKLSVTSNAGGYLPAETVNAYFAQQHGGGKHKKIVLQILQHDLKTCGIIGKRGNRENRQKQDN